MDSSPKILFTKAPVIKLVPKVNLQDNNNNNLYICPVYKTLERKGTLSTTGHSTNFVMYINVPTQLSRNHWVKRGVAFLC